MTPTPAKVLVPDPPWPFKDALLGKGRGAAKHYKLMSIDLFELPPIAPPPRLRCSQGVRVLSKGPGTGQPFAAGRSCAVLL